MKEDNLYLIHISESIARIEQYMPLSRDAFLKSPLVQDAIIRNIQVLAESSQRLSDSLKQKYPEIPWREMSGFRNVLVHNYLGVDLIRIWEILQNDLPKLQDRIDHILDDI